MRARCFTSGDGQSNNNNSQCINKWVYAVTPHSSSSRYPFIRYNNRRPCGGDGVIGVYASVHGGTKDIIVRAQKDETMYVMTSMRTGDDDD